MCCDIKFIIHLTKTALCWWLTNTNTYDLILCAVYTGSACQISTAVWAIHLSLLVSVDRDEQTARVINAAYGLQLKGRYNLSSYSIITDFCWTACPWIPMFSVTCADVHTCHLFIYVPACLWEQQCIHKQEQLPLFTFKDLLLADDERYAAVYWVWTSWCRRSLCEVVCQCYIRGCWIWAHCIMDLSVSQEKWIRRWSKACPVC